jgi:DNA-binding PadR family transcriptional regulator
MILTDERKLLLLGLLRQSDMHGYLLNAHLDGSVPISLKKPTAYNLLDRMERDGWIEHRDEPTGERPRKVFSLTMQGETAFRTLLIEQLRTFRPTEFPSAVSLTFLDALPSRKAMELLQQRREAAEAYRAQIGSLADEARTRGDAHDVASGVGAHLAITYSLRFAQLEIELLDDAIAGLRVRAGTEASS